MTVSTAIYGHMHMVFYRYFVPINCYMPPTWPGAAGTVMATVLHACTVPLYSTQWPALLVWWRPLAIETACDEPVDTKNGAWDDGQCWMLTGNMPVWLKENRWENVCMNWDIDNYIGGLNRFSTENCEMIFWSTQPFRSMFGLCCCICTFCHLWAILEHAIHRE